MLHPEEIIDLSEYLKRQEFQSSPYQIFAAQQVLFSEAARNSGTGSLVRLSSLLGPIFCRTPEEQQKFAELYLQWLRQRSGRANTIPSTPTGPGPGPEIPTSHWRMKVLGVALLILPILTAWFLWEDLRPRQVVGHVMTEEQVVLQATVRLGEQAITTDADGKFSMPFHAKDMPMMLAVENGDFLPKLIPIGQEIKSNRTWFYLYPLDWSGQLNIGAIILTKEEALPGPPKSPRPDPPNPPLSGPSESPIPETIQPSPAKLSFEKIETLKSPTPPWWERLNYEILGKVLAPALLAIVWLLYPLTRRRGLLRQSSRIPPELKHVQVQVDTQHIFPSLSLRHITQRLRQTQFVESTELDVHRTIQLTMDRGGLFTPVYGSKHEPGYVALIDRSTMADHQAHLAAQLVKDLARGYVLVRQYEFDEQPHMLRRVDPLRPSLKQDARGTALATAVEVVSLEEVQAKFPARRLLYFADPITCFDPLTGKLRTWVETLEVWEERFLLTTTNDGQWGKAERILSRRGFQVIPLSFQGLRLFSILLDLGSSRPNQKRLVAGTTYFHDRMPERWLERHPPSQEFIHRLLGDLEKDFSSEQGEVNAERGIQGMLWLAACAAYPEIHWALTLEWGVRLFGQGSTAERLLPKLTRLVWFRQAFMPDWFRKALYDRLTPPEADWISQDLSEILSAVNPENREELHLHIATQPGAKPAPASAVGPIRTWVRRLRRKLNLQAMGQAAEPGSPMGDFVMLQYLSGKQSKALTPYAPKALLRLLFPKGQPWLGFRPVFLMAAIVLATGGLWWWLDPIPVPLPSPIQAVALSQDGYHLAVGRDGRLQVWDWKMREIVVDVPEDQGLITTVALSADGTLGATGFQDGSIHLWDGTTGAETATINAHSEPIVSLAFNPDGDRLASGDARGKVLLTVTKSGKSQVVSLTNSLDQKTALSFSPDGLVLAIGKNGGGISLLSDNAKTIELIRELTSQAGALLSLAWDPTGKFIMSYSKDGIVRIWNQGLGQLVSQEQIGPSEVGSLIWSNGPEAWLALLGSEGPEVRRIKIPPRAFPAQWHLQPTPIPDGKIGQQKNGIPAWDHANVVAAWDTSMGEGITIAVIADGFDLKHEEFAGPNKIVFPRNVTTGTDDPTPGARDNFGTAFAGVAVANGQYGAAGVAPRAKLMPIRNTSPLGSQQEADAIVWAVDHGADVISLGSGPEDGAWWDPRDPLHKRVAPLPDTTRLALEHAVTNGRAGKGTVIVIAAGNGNESVDNDGYASNKMVIAVAASHAKGKKSAYSDFGKAIWCTFPSNDTVQPLPGIWTTDRSGAAGYNPGQASRGDVAGNYINDFGGTSSAAQGVVGVVALILSVNPELRWEEVKDILKKSSDKIDKRAGKYDKNGHSLIYGYGRVNALQAVKLARTYAQQPSANPQTSVGNQTELNPKSPAETKATQPPPKKISNPPNSAMPQQASNLLPQQNLNAPLQQLEGQPAQQQEVQQQQADQVEKLPTKITGKDGAPMVLVPAGEFTMGFGGFVLSGWPVHQVYLDAYYLDQFEMTTSRYGKFLENTNRDTPRDWSETVPKQQEKKPVVGVTWDDANAYCKWSGKRLPTEAEWEKAARGTDQRLYPWGNEKPYDGLANFNRCCDKVYDLLTDVGSFEGGKSPYGVYDMTGNAKEWVADWTSPDTDYMESELKKLPRKNPLGPGKGQSKVLRGGGWRSVEYFETYERNTEVPSHNYDDIGFRCAQGAP